MKSIYKLMSIGALAVMASSCADDLNTEYYGAYVTTEQKEETLGMDPAKALAGVTGAFSSLNRYMSVYSNHFDFGYPAVMIGLDLQTEDFIGLESGYNWHQYWEAWINPNNNGVPTNMMWHYAYSQVFAANALIETIAPDTDDDELMFFLANGHAIRAFDYFTLVQTYQFNYVGNENKLGLPIITEQNQAEASVDGCARSTVAETYAQIEKDIDTAISLLEKSSVTASDVIDSKPNRLITLASAYGLRARIHLVKHEYAKAAELAEKAIKEFSGRPYTIAEVSKPSFTSLEDPSWMWGLAIAETDRVVTSGIVNWPSFVCTFSDGYVNVGSWKYCGRKLYDYIPSSDVRKGWFIDDNYTSPNLSDAQQKYIDEYVDPSLNVNKLLNQGNLSISNIWPQTNVKFGPYNGIVGTSVNANDIPFMRVEEMYYIKAEGQAMSGNTAGALETLTNFVKTYRDPKYSFSGSSAEAIQNEILWQRRAELWGEGLVYFDIMRLNQGVDRRNDRYPGNFRFNIAPNDPVLIYCVPESEITANAKISYSEANASAPSPTPVAE
ncbi:MAG: RagB/SusD family nutrient uptake outer membrane protein [Clostridium sp.]|nr:RagB/SusD family nutrient uptake outer membrane protein [Clostridium sp.]